MENNKNTLEYTNDSFLIDSFTKENLSGYLKKLELSQKKVLTINTSGDDILNAMFFGANDLTLCTKNNYAKYYLYLKLAGLKALSYNEFCWFFMKNNMNMRNNNKMFSKRLFRKIGPTLDSIDKDSYLFFDELFDIYTPKETRNNCFSDSNYHSKAIKNFNIYLRNEYSYNKLRNMSSNTNINFIDKSILDTNIDQEYDVILLSTLCTEMKLRRFLKLIKKLDKNLSSDGLIMLGYLWNNNIYTPSYDKVWEKIYQNPKANKLLSKYLTDVYEVGGYRNYLWENSKQDDKVLVYRKKN